MVLPLEYQPDHALSGRSVSVPFGPYRHYGTLFVLDGMLSVFANSAAAGSGRLEPWDEFANGKAWRFEPDYDSALGWREKFERAGYVERRAYDAVAWNCEHFVNYLQGLPIISRQVRVTAAVLLLAAASAVAFSKAA